MQVVVLPRGERPRLVRLRFPEAKSPEERVGIGTRPSPRRQRFQFLDVPATAYHLVGFEDRDQVRDDLLDVTLPFLAPQSLKASGPYIMFERAFLVAKPAKLQRFHNPVHDHGSAQAGAQSK